MAVTRVSITVIRDQQGAVLILPTLLHLIWMVCSFFFGLGIVVVLYLTVNGTPLAKATPFYLIGSLILAVVSKLLEKGLIRKANAKLAQGSQSK